LLKGINGGEVDVSSLMQTVAARSEASSGYIASLRKYLGIFGETDSLDYAREKAVQDIGLARKKIEDYFRENIIHKGITVIDRPNDTGWLALQLAGGEMRIYVRGGSEALLLKNFMERRKKDIDVCMEDYIAREELLIRASERCSKNLIDTVSEIEEMVNFSLASRIADLRYKVEYIVFLQNILDREKQIMPGISGELSGNGA